VEELGLETQRHLTDLVEQERAAVGRLELPRLLPVRACEGALLVPEELGLERIEDTALDAMFLDVSMPGMNGLEVLAEVRRRRPTLAVVVITGHATEHEIDEVRRLGAVDVIAKPAALTHYHRAIERLSDTRNPFQPTPRV
jgi:CheY-like chemotaxis protein